MIAVFHRSSPIYTLKYQQWYYRMQARHFWEQESSTSSSSPSLASIPTPPDTSKYGSNAVWDGISWSAIYLKHALDLFKRATTSSTSAAREYSYIVDSLISRYHGMIDRVRVDNPANEYVVGLLLGDCLVLKAIKIRLRQLIVSLAYDQHYHQRHLHRRIHDANNPLGGSKVGVNNNNNNNNLEWMQIMDQAVAATLTAPKTTDSPSLPVIPIHEIYAQWLLNEYNSNLNSYSSRDAYLRRAIGLYSHSIKLWAYRRTSVLGLYLALRIAGRGQEAADLIRVYNEKLVLKEE